MHLARSRARLFPHRPDGAAAGAGSAPMRTRIAYLRDEVAVDPVGAGASANWFCSAAAPAPGTFFRAKEFA